MTNDNVKHKPSGFNPLADNYQFVDNVFSEFRSSYKGDLEKFTLSWLLKNSYLEECLFSSVDKTCIKKKISSDYDFSQQNLRNGLFLHGMSTESNQTHYAQELIENSIILPNTETTIEHTSNLYLKIDGDNKTVLVASNSNKTQSSQIKVSGGTLDGWNFIIEKETFLGYKKHAGSRSSNLGLTGCITFHDIKLVSLKLSMEQSMCEDAVHFVRAQGNVEYISVNNSSDDAIDADFSDLHFAKLEISDAGNDCVDFSGGIFFINYMMLKNCGDKGISAGEGSIVSLDNGKINQALIGLVAKDGSTLSVNYAGLYDVDVCLSVYNKKQEYAGGLLKINNIDCPSNKYYSQTGSRIDML
ncbi:hypothetical protein ES708_20728 [subsurface metagenome]